jgi:hypothetical protein
MEELVLTVCKHVYHVTIAHMKRVLWLSVLRPLFSRRRALSSLNALQVEAAHLAERDHGLLQRPLGAMIRVAAVLHTTVTHKQQSGTHSFRVASTNEIVLYFFFEDESRHRPTSATNDTTHPLSLSGKTRLRENDALARKSRAHG